MSYIKKINKKLEKAFNGNVEAREDSGRLILSGELALWEDVVRAGQMAAGSPRKTWLVNDIRCTGVKSPPQRMPRVKDDTLAGETPDVLIVGGGIVGCAIARELTRYSIDVMLVEKEYDLALHASGRNDGMVHSGIDLKMGTLKYRYNKLGNRMFGDVCNELGVEFNRCGQYLCFDRGFWKPVLYLSLIYWKWVGLSGVKVVSRRKLRGIEQSIPRKVGSALFFPATGVVCPFDLTLAYAENAAYNGARIRMETAVLGMDEENGLINKVTTNRGKIYPKVVVNAAGVFSEDIAAMAGDRFFSIHPRKGTNLIMDKKFSAAIVSTAISSFSTSSTRKTHSKGGGIIRTTGGNALVGPDAVETIEKEDFSTTRQSVAGTLRRQGKTSTAIKEGQIINYFSGIRACTYEEDFVICKGRRVKNIVHAAGIQSPGLTAAPAIGVDVAAMVVDILKTGGEVEESVHFDPIRKAPPRLNKLDDAARAGLISGNPDYGVIVCRCEEISKGEVLDALRREIPCDTLDGVKRRARPGMGRCQGGFCTPLVLDIISKEKKLAPAEVRKSFDDSELLFGKTKLYPSEEVSSDAR